MKTTAYRWLPMALILVLAVTAGSASAAPTAPTPFEQACRALADRGGPDDERLRELFAVAWAYRMGEFPETATYSGYPGQNDRWTDLSAEAGMRPSSSGGRCAWSWTRECTPMAGAAGRRSITSWPRPGKPSTTPPWRSIAISSDPPRP